MLSVTNKPFLECRYAERRGALWFGS